MNADDHSKNVDDAIVLITTSKNKAKKYHRSVFKDNYLKGFISPLLWSSNWNNFMGVTK
jgi:hypothetical protein